MNFINSFNKGDSLVKKQRGLYLKPDVGAVVERMIAFEATFGGLEGADV